MKKTAVICLSSLKKRKINLLDRAKGGVRMMSRKRSLKTIVMQKSRKKRNY